MFYEKFEELVIFCPICILPESTDISVLLLG